MKGKLLSVLLSGALLCAIQVSGYAETYRGAVVEYHPEYVGTEEQNVAKNVENYVKFIQEAKAKKADIIVFPEMGLTETKLASSIPDPIDEVIPCDDANFETTKAVKDLSCASKNSQIYSVINLQEKRKCGIDDKDCPLVGYYLYNTNVVFDRRGAVIARYAKYNLFDENNRQAPKDPEIVFFDTDFGVRFGTFICFDILFQTPTLRLVKQFDITDFVFTTYWFSELPFLTALQVQRGWAESNNVNLLASGVNKIETGSAGSGIYNGKLGHLVEIFPEAHTSKLLIANIPKIRNTCTANVCKRDTRETFAPSVSVNAKAPAQIQESEPQLSLLKDQIQLFKSEVVQTGKPTEQTICGSRNFCCNFYVDVDAVRVNAKNFTYRAVVFNGVRQFGKSFRGGVQACGVILCDGPHLNNCTSRVQKIPELFHFKEIRISGNFKLRNSFQMPSTLTDGERLEPLSANKYEFKKTEKKDGVDVELELLWPVTNLHTFAIWGRDFTRDNEPEFPVAGSTSITSIPCLLAAFLGFALFAR